ncbi:MAG: type I glyceraldehyde-3-phosphate dehydrogenase [Candidatus Sungbacteria bacterium RIFCSPLOWO2_12_FULL_41_11]|uniref:Type I glyceraldehyde-3-phosphate dehydrogenase n=1 Tax=Candidatus Sungbacteria bacterium RIFCSPLOWO2_12_FULL_41_11 TaxID=1802286 RepID=A0A1G2LT70_9BACT|nr:MAG: Glyceraldehyde-3-phosphate dehydrogenase / erythrose 4 phosphate dehydrogenase [Parcubacteria group bacterium GW2011_GWA2_42_14]OGZ99318.1 MAG: type I glyceraldehyde-3-phosphate dehydrogenase [Candidatus Sungbacteria bacterium RIFCSPHIGHO2_02_FULL_41_12b]OHA14845.1 MAG: type I glyceraldehyde-3-phosphate dehydrogenase [Candidatus Sungbacteria bacterium RIFCSPLOWO2_12_FULL_41_11]
MKLAKIAINGFGRIGRSFFRAVFALSEFDIVAVNDLSDTKTLAYLLKYDSVYGRYQKEVSASDGELIVDGKKVKVLAEKEPAKLPWKDLGIDIVVESTGFFADGEKAKAHLDAGAKRVVITAPAKGDVQTVLVGVNDDLFKKGIGPITCNASCTTNSVAPVVEIIRESLGIKKAAMTTVHGYTATQKLVDGPVAKDVRRGRAAAVNIVPSTTGAAEAVIQSIPEMKGIFGALSMRVPVITGSLSDTTMLVSRKTNTEEVNALFRKAAQNPRWSKILKVTEDQIVSTDIIGEPYGAIVDLSLTKVIDGDLIKVFSWYDNEAGYTATLVEHVRRVAEQL